MKEKLKKLKKLKNRINKYISKTELLQKEYDKIDEQCHKATNPIYMIAKDGHSVIKITGYCVYENKEGRAFDSVWYYSTDGVGRESSSWFLTSIERDYEEKPKEQCFKLFKEHIKNEEKKKVMFFNESLRKANKYMKELEVNPE